MENKINEEVIALLTEFLELHIYPRILDKDNLLAVLTYGSSLTGFSSQNSDIDLLIILNNAEETIRGVKYFKGKKVEYFIKPIEKFLSESVKFTKSNCPSHVALQQNAYFIYDKAGLVSNILKADVEYYNTNRTIPKDNYDLKLVQIENRIASLKNIYERQGIEFAMVYFNILEMIRALHSKKNDEAEIPFAKAFRIYTNPEYYDKFVSNNAGNTKPDDKFVKLYVKCIEEHSDPEIMLKNLDNLFDYEKGFYEINPEDYEISLK